MAFLVVIMEVGYPDKMGMSQDARKVKTKEASIGLSFQRTLKIKENIQNANTRFKCWCKADEELKMSRESGRNGTEWSREGMHKGGSGPQSGSGMKCS